LEFYYYECESINDRGWGSGWRCFQTFLKTAQNYIKKMDKNNDNKFTKLNNFDISFENLFLTYGDRAILDNIYIKKRLEYLANKISEIEKEKEKENTNLEIFRYEKEVLEKNILSDFLKEKLYAPFETQYAWAEPLILDLICFDFDIKGKLYLINGPIEFAYTPKQLFEKILSFEDFINLAFENFNNKKRPFPIIIDDSTVSLCIIGLTKISKENNENIFKFLIADPHISKNSYAIGGIYSVEISENGKFLNENNKYNKMNGKRLRFDRDEFMVFIADDIGDN